MKKYLFEIYENGFDRGTTEYHEEYGNTVAEAEAKLMAEFPKGYVLQIFTPFVEEYQNDSI